MNNSITKVTSLQAGLKDHGVMCGKDKSFLASKVPRLALGPTQPPLQ